MKNLGLEFKVGLFTILGVMATGTLFVYLGEGFFESEETKSYYTLLGNAGGIVEKSHVKTNGVTVGKVKSVDLGANSTKISFEVRADVPIPRGSTLMVKSVGFLGDTHLEIYRTDEKDLLGDGELVPENSEGTDLNGLIDTAGSIAKDIKKITANLADVLGTDVGKQKIGNIVDNIEAFTDDARGILEENREDVRQLIVNIREAAESVNGILDPENRDKIDRIIASFDDAMVDVKSATRNINLISERVERGDGTLGKLVNDDTALEELQGAIRDIREVLAPATRLQIAVDARLEARQDDTSQTYFNLVFRTRPDRYYLLGFTDLTEDVEERRTIDDGANQCQDEDQDGETCDSAVRIKSKERKAIRYNLQFAKRWGFIAARFGLFESTGGIATDLYLLSDRLRFSIEAFDWQTKDNPVRRVAHLKAYASVLFFDHIYLMVGIDDPTKYKVREDPSEVQDPNYFVGAGLTFNDQDLKALFGAAALGSAL